MITYTRKVGATDVSVVIRIVDSTDGTPETAVTSATGGLALEYRREGATSTPITESDLTNLNDAHSDGGMKHIGNGYYRVDLPDAACETGSKGVLIHGTATGMIVVGAYIELIGSDPFVDTTDAENRFLRAVKGNVLGTVGTGSTTTSIVTSSLDPAASATDQYKGRILVFAADTTTANLRGQGTDITASTTGGVLTVSALSHAPASTDTFTIL